METIFAYGTLKDPKVQQEVIGREIEGAADHLDGCIKSHFQHGDRKTYPVIICPIEGHGVDGITFDVTPEELTKIDQYEEDFYKRQRVRLKSGREAWTYTK
ncbi:MAG TPA: gamma-glutamylcyclotransferase family protein [Candidatus Paceibacterota bacterium]|nr:gamma-glutamylcyclotransferase family protein [Candidatus Paceibacterota bacterium]